MVYLSASASALTLLATLASSSPAPQFKRADTPSRCGYIGDGSTRDANNQIRPIFDISCNGVSWNLDEQSNKDQFPKWAVLDVENDCSYCITYSEPGCKNGKQDEYGPDGAYYLTQATAAEIKSVKC